MWLYSGRMECGYCGADAALVVTARIENWCVWFVFVFVGTLNLTQSINQNKFGCLAPFLAGCFRFNEGQGIC